MYIVLHCELNLNMFKEEKYTKQMLTFYMCMHGCICAYN
jgi:hypothetical protein